MGSADTGCNTTAQFGACVITIPRTGTLPLGTANVGVDVQVTLAGSGLVYTAKAACAPFGVAGAGTTATISGTSKIAAVNVVP